MQARLWYYIMGETHVRVVKLDEVSDTITNKSMADLNKYLLGADFSGLAAGNLKVSHGTLTPRDILYVPAGWFMCEQAAKGPLCYGMRKSLFVNSSSQKASYKKAAEMLKKDGRTVDPMMKLLELFK